MFKRAIAGLFVAAACLAGCMSQPLSDPTPGMPRTIIRDVDVIPIESPGLARKRDVVIEGDRIAKIVPGGSTRAGPADRIVDGRGRYLMPALWDMHAHVSATADGGRLDASEAGAIAQSVLPRYIGYGVVGVRDPAIRLDVLAKVRQDLRGRDDLPRLVASGPILEGSRSPWSHDHEINVTTPEEGRAAVAELDRAGVDFVKVYNRLSPESFDAIAEEARARGLRIAGHIPFDVTLEHATASGLKAVEHLYVNLFKDCTSAGNEAFPSLLNAWIRDGYQGRYELFHQLYGSRDPERCQALFRRLAEREVFVTPVLSLEVPIDGTMTAADWDALPADAVEPCRATLESYSAVPAAVKQQVWQDVGEILRSLQQAKVPLMAGADTPLPCQSFGHAVHKELQLMVRAGLLPQEALRTATINPALFLGLENEGVIRPGAKANLLLLDANPLEDVSNTLAIAGLMFNGSWHDKEKLESLRSIGTQQASIIENAQVWTGNGFERRALAIRGNRFVPLAEASASARRIDLGGGYVVPAYANAHAHLTDATEERSNAYLRAGIFYVWNPNTIVMDQAALDFYARKDTFDVAVAQGGITEPGGHPDHLYTNVLSKYVYKDRPRDWFIGNAFHYGRDKEEIDAALDLLKEQKADFVKAYLLHSEDYQERLGNPALEGKRGLSPANFRYLVAAARERGLDVVAHVETVQDLLLAARSGAAVAAHLPAYWGVQDEAALPALRLTAAQAKEVADSGMALVPTYGIAAGQFDEREAEPAVRKRLFDIQSDNVRLLREAGATFLHGTDGAGPIFGEAEHLVRIGAFTDADAAAMVLGTGRRLFPERRIGCFDPGCEADFLLLSGDPTRDISALRTIQRGWKAGEELRYSAPQGGGGGATGLVRSNSTRKKRLGRRSS